MLQQPIGRGAYGIVEDFAEHRSELRKTATTGKDNADHWLLLGYYEFYSNQMSKAAVALGNAAKLRPDDPLAVKLAALARSSAARRD